jgi:hypothetical protein
MKNKIFIVVFFQLILSIFLNAQTPIKYSENIPSSPTAMNFTKYGVIPVTLYSGMASNSIPLYELQEGSINLPITLSYNNRGYKPSEYAGSTGLGWNIQAEGMVTRIVRGQVDENPEMVDINNYIGYADIKMKFEDFADISQSKYSQKILSEISSGITDGEPDIYTFNFGGHSGNFIIRNNEAIFMPKQNIKVKITTTVSGNIFVFTTENGTAYLFGTDGFEISEPSDFHQNKPAVKPYVSAWHLTKITSSDKSHFVDFYYNVQKVKHENNIGGSYKLTYSDTGTPTGAYSTFANYGASISSKVLTKITALPSNQTLNFNSGALRTDIKDYQNSYTLATLGNIAITNMHNDLIKKWVFTYNYFGTNSFKKLKLLSVHQENSSNETLNKHSFNYNNENAELPDKDTKGIDHWGYYNGQNNNNCLIPAEILPTGTMVGAIPGNRTPDKNYGMNTVLAKITYPTGGYSLFEYEQNLYYNNASNNNNAITIPQNFYIEYNPDNAVWDNDDYYVKSGFSFPICEQQNVNFTYRFKMPNKTSTSLGAEVFYPVFRIVKVWNECDDVASINPNTEIWKRTGKFWPIDENGTYEVSDVVNLTPGTYSVQVKINSEISSFYSCLNYKEVGNISSSYKFGPGLRISEIKNYNKDNTLLTHKRYEYLKDDGTSSGVMISPSSYKISDYIDRLYTSGSIKESFNLTYYDNLESNISSLMNEKLYYSKVSEYTVRSADQLKSDYYYSSYDYYYAGVDLTKQIDFNYDAASSNYIQNHSKEFSYSIVDEDLNIMCLESKLSIMQRLSGNTYLLPIDNSLDNQDPNKYYNQLYSENSYIIPVGLKKLTAENEKFFYYTNNVLTNTVVTDKVYNYHSDTPHYPYEIIQNTSTTKTNYTNPVYCYDYNLLDTSVKLPLQIETDYTQSLLSIIGTYMINRGTNYNSFITYYNAYNALRNNKKTELNTYNTALDNKINSESDLSKKATLMMQRDNILTYPLQQKRYVKDGTKKLIGAEKYVFTAWGGSVQFSEFWNCEIDAPIDLALFTENLYKKKVTNFQDSQSNLLGQNQDDAIDYAYIWGYNNTYPIAKITNATHANVMSVLDASVLSNNPSKDEVQAYLAPLATNNATKNAQVTFFTYKPAVGMKTMTDPRGVTTYYEYDNFNRLKQTYIIENGEKKILQKNDYHYATQQ